MAKWAVVERHEIKELHDSLPKNWQHISGLNLSENNLPFLASLGWLPVEEDLSGYDALTHRVVNWQYSVEPTKVKATAVLEILPEQNNPGPVEFVSPEISLRDRQLFAFPADQRLLLDRWMQYHLRAYLHQESADPPFEMVWQEVRQTDWSQATLDSVRIMRNKLLLTSDFTQLHDVRDNMPAIQQQHWVEFRQRLRELPQRWQEGDRAWPHPPSLHTNG